MWQRITALGFPPLYSERTARIPQESGRVQLGREGRLFTADPSSYDGSVPREAMGAMSPLEELAYLKARNAYLEELVAAQKKLRSALEDTTISLNPKV